MAQQLAYTFELFGPRTGFTGKLGNHYFENGVAQLVVDPVNAGFVMQNMRYYKGFAKGTAEYDAAVEEAAREAKDGTDEVHTETEHRETDEVHAGVRPDGIGPDEEASEISVGNDDPETGDSGVQPSGDGHEDTGLPKFEEEQNKRAPTEPEGSIDPVLVNALLSLDPSNDDHWVATGKHAGKAKVTVVAVASGKAGATRSDLEASLPGFNREVAASQQEEVEI